MKYILVILVLMRTHSLHAQCPYISGALMDAANVGTPAGEGKSEFVAFTTGTSSLAVNGFSVGYGTTVAASDLTIDGTTISWQILGGTPAITNSAGTITNITSGSIPPSTPVVLLNADNTISYDLATFGANVYVLVFSSGDAGVSGYIASGRFANKSAPSGLRYFRVTAGACNNVVSYDKNAADYSLTDGAGAKWTSSGTISYYSTGASGLVLPVGLLGFYHTKQEGESFLNWSTSGSSTTEYFQIEKSNDGSAFSGIGVLNAIPENGQEEKKYIFPIKESYSSLTFYRLRLKDKSGKTVFSPVLKVGKNDNRGASKSSVYPNPASNELYVELANPALTKIILRDYSGKIIMEKDILAEKFVWDIGALAPGFYSLQLSGAAEPEFHKIIKQ